MGGVILLVAYNLVDMHHIKAIFHTSRSESAIFLVTFMSTLFLELEFAIYIGVLLSLVIFLAKTSKPKITTLAPDITQKQRNFTDIETKPLNECGQLKVVRVDRSIFFGSVSYLQLKLQAITAGTGIKHILLVASRINYIDMAGAEMLLQEAERLKAAGGGLYVYGLKDELWEFLAEGGYLKRMGAQYFFDKKSDAISAIYNRLDHQLCRQCPAPVFMECQREQEQATVA